MDVFGCILCFSAGVVVDALYNRARRFAERDAWREGYGRAKREEDIRNATREKYEQAQPIPNNNSFVIPNQFINDFRRYGHAATIISNNGGARK